MFIHATLIKNTHDNIITSYERKKAIIASFTTKDEAVKKLKTKVDDIQEKKYFIQLSIYFWRYDTRI